jgi:NAD(P)-dependent dehydrogenase (short-subunit alcohol dehydrogenase family)
METVELDMTDPTSIDQVAAKLIAEHPDLNVPINNAGRTMPSSPIPAVLGFVPLAVQTRRVFITRGDPKTSEDAARWFYKNAGGEL